MGQIHYRKLNKDDIPRLIEMRLQQLNDEGATESFDLRPSLLNFYKQHLTDNTFISWVALDNNIIIATSGISLVEKPPYYSNPSGKIGLLTNMYTLREYRRKGIAKKLLNKVIDEAKDCGCGSIQLTASNMGVLLYTDYGFEKNNNFMEFKLSK